MRKRPSAAPTSRPAFSGPDRRRDSPRSPSWLAELALGRTTWWAVRSRYGWLRATMPAHAKTRCDGSRPARRVRRLFGVSDSTIGNHGPPVRLIAAFSTWSRAARRPRARPRSGGTAPARESVDSTGTRAADPTLSSRATGSCRRSHQRPACRGFEATRRSFAIVGCRGRRT